MRIRASASQLWLLRAGLIAALLLFSVYCGVSVLRASSGTGSSGQLSGSGHEPLRRRAHSLLAQGGRHAHKHAASAGEDGADDVVDDTSVHRSKPCPACPACPKISDLAKQLQERPKVISTAAMLRNPRRYHVVTTVQGFSNHWQARIHYYWFKRQREVCEEQGGGCDMGGFTRLLHSGEADDLMDEIPTVVVDPLPASAFGAEYGNSYVVLNRPYAFTEWLKKASVPERYIVMCEADHLFMRPMPNMMNGEASGAALFTYINPDKYPEVVRSLVGPISDAELATIPRIGNSPTFVSIAEFKTLAPIWFNTTMDIWNNKPAHDAWNWVLEMYGYSLATFRAGQHKNLKTWENMLAHPPWDTKEVDHNGDPFYLLHLTYPLRYNSTGGITENETEVVWKFDKRAFSEKPPARNLADPPPIVNNDLARLIIKMFNEATNAIPCWDEYVAHKIVTTDCGSAPRGAHSDRRNVQALGTQE